MARLILLYLTTRTDASSLKSIARSPALSVLMTRSGVFLHGWNDHYADPATSYDLLGARLYNPATGTFLTLDPLLQPGTLALGGYAYADGNPATNDDPTGLGVNTYEACADPRCGTSTGVPALPSHGGLTDLADGLINAGYSAAISSLTTLALVYGGPAAANTIKAALPGRIPIGNPDTTTYQLGTIAPLLASLLLTDRA